MLFQCMHGLGAKRLQALGQAVLTGHELCQLATSCWANCNLQTSVRISHGGLEYLWQASASPRRPSHTRQGAIHVAKPNTAIHCVLTLTTSTFLTQPKINCYRCTGFGKPSTCGTVIEDINKHNNRTVAFILHAQGRSTYYPPVL